MQSLGEEEATARLLRLAGAPIDASLERTARVREAVHHAWRAQSRRRATVRRAVYAGLALAAVAVFVLFVPSKQPAAPEAVVVATGVRIEGAPVRQRTIGGRIERSAITPDSSLLAGDVVETDGVSRVSLRTADGSSVRFDRATRARLVAAQAIELLDGAVYVATAETSRGFEVRTTSGTVRDVGTQFEVRLTGAQVRVRVRSGRIDLHRDAAVIPAGAGTEVTVTATGVQAVDVPIHGPAWAWTASVAPPVASDGRPLASFLEEVAREEGWVLRYADPALARAVSGIILRGSIGDLRGEDAVKVALSTSGLQYRLRDGEVVVSKPAG